MSHALSPSHLVDTHCHLCHPVFAGQLDTIIKAARLAGVQTFIVPGIEPEEWERLNLLQAGRKDVFAAFGIHPMHAGQHAAHVMERLESFASSAVAIGEIGLDYSLGHVPRQQQIALFRHQLRLARKHSLPVLIHCRKAFQDLLSILKDEMPLPVRGSMHAFSGSLETAVQLIDMGLHISIAGTATFSNAVRPLQVARDIPLQKMLLETDAPDLTPEPYRGHRNQPAFLIETAKKVAEIRGVSLMEVANATSSNAMQLFRLNPINP